LHIYITAVSTFVYVTEALLRNLSIISERYE